MDDALTPEGFVSACATTRTLPALWRLALQFFQSRGIVMVSYHVDDTRGYDTERKGVIEEGFPRDWVCQYLDANLRLVDPIPGLAARLSRPFFWSETAALTHLSPQQHEYLRLMSESDLGDGLAMQVYGPSMRNAYVGLGFGTARRRMTAEEIFELQSAAQIAHLRYCEMTEEDQETAPLSPRETEVLKWMAKGKSNAVIAEILGLSRHTVDTICRRVFDKLAVNDRTSAAIRGIGAGILSYRRHDYV